MGMIVVHHLEVHGRGLIDLMRGNPPAGGVGVWDFGLNSLVVPAVNAFVMLSGYFGIRFRARNLAFLSFQGVVYSIVVWLVYWGLTGTRGGFGLPTHYWFLVCYLGLVLLAPAIHRLLDGMDEPAFLAFVILVGLGWFGIGFLGRTNQILGTGYGLGQMLALYLVGRALKRWRPRWESWSSRMLLSGWAISFAIEWALVLVVVRRSPGLAWSLYGYDNPLVVASAIFQVMLFVRIRRPLPMATVLSSHVFAVYLLHDNDLSRAWLATMVKKAALEGAEPLLAFPLAALGVLLVGMAVDVAVRPLVDAILSRRPLRDLCLAVDRRMQPLLDPARPQGTGSAEGN